MRKWGQHFLGDARYIQEICAAARLSPDDAVLEIGSGKGALTVELGRRAGKVLAIEIDPVLVASDGQPLLEQRAWEALRSLIARATLVTPNLPEAEALTGVDTSRGAGVETAARFFVEELGAGAALVKGGHREGPPDDLLAHPGPSGVTLEWLRGDRIDAGHVHGTGCALSSAITAALARGDDLSCAVARGREFVTAALRRAEGLGQGARLLVFP